MPVFDQRNQKVKYQYNVNGTINFGSAQNRTQVINALKKLPIEVTKAAEVGVLDAENSANAQAKLSQAVIEAEKPEPDKNVIVDYLNKAKRILTNVVAVAGLVKGISEAIEIVRKLF